MFWKKFWKKSEKQEGAAKEAGVKKRLVSPKLAAGIVIIVVAAWGVSALLDLFSESPITPATKLHEEKSTIAPVKELHPAAEHPPAPSPEELGTVPPEPWMATEKQLEKKPHPEHPAPRKDKIKHEVKGAATVVAAIEVMDYELSDRFWGWHPNDLLRLTDNVENYQLGVLDVVRRTSIMLAEKLSRFGGSDKFDHHLENAMNWFMITPTRYWLPSPEDKYSAGLKEMHHYIEMLEKGESKFYARADHLLPLLATYEDLLGSCHHHLIKEKEDDGTPVRWLMVDDYFYFSKGVADAMRNILIAIKEDFKDELNAKGGMKLLDRAIESLGIAAKLNPLIVTNGPKDGILANHRANMAAPISDARYTLQVLQTTMAT
jgi:hypothetical protein